jgi:exosome complex component CSL4
MESIVSEDTYVPGDKICLSSHARSGAGTYVSGAFICASLLGKAKIERETVVHPNSKSAEPKTASLPTVSIKTVKENAVVIPHIGSLVVAKVTSVNPRYAKCSILSVNNVVVKENFPGQVSFFGGENKFFFDRNFWREYWEK